MILIKVNQSATTASRESVADLAPNSSKAVNISLVIGYPHLAISSSLSLARIIFVHMLLRSERLAGMGRSWSQNRVFMLSTYPHTVAEREF